MKTTLMIIMIIVAFTAVGVGDSAHSNPVLLGNIAAYDQGLYPWCTFVSEMSLFSYWDMHGYPNLLTTDSPEIFQTNNVWSDVLNLVSLSHLHGSVPVVPWDLMLYSESKGVPLKVVDNYFYQQIQGGPSSHFVDTFEPGFNFLTGPFNYTVDYSLTSSPFTIEMIENEIDNGRPLLYISNDKDPTPNHATVVFGYNITQNGSYIGYYQNSYESETVLWKPFDSTWMSHLIMVEPIIVQSAPEPATLLLVVSGLIGLLGLKRKFKN